MSEELEAPGGEDWREGLTAPEKDSRPQTEDVTATKGVTWEQMALKVSRVNGVLCLLCLGTVAAQLRAAERTEV